MSLGSIMTREDVRTAITHRDGAPDYQRLKRHVREDGISLARAVEDHQSASLIRRSYAELDRALDRAVALAARQVRAPYLTSDTPAPPPLDNDRAHAWNVEVRRLRDMRERLRFIALDDPRCRRPATVRVTTRAATGPRRSGLRVDEHREVMPAGNGMGIDLLDVLDRISARMSTATPAPDRTPETRTEEVPRPSPPPTGSSSVAEAAPTRRV